MKPYNKLLICICCGKRAFGKQWWNQEDGYGLCAQCGKQLREKGEPRLEESYGIRGVHYDINAKGKLHEKASHYS